jgi:hypothetical protein
LEEFKVDLVGKKISQFKQKWLNHVISMENMRYPNQLLDYRPIGRRRRRRRPGLPLKRLLDGCHEAQTGQLLA